MTRQFALNKIKEGDVCVEIGVWKGHYSSQIISHNCSRLYLIDPWLHQPYKGRLYNISQAEMDDIFLNVQQKFKNDPKVTIFREFSNSVDLSTIEKFDWVYIDGNHSYHNVMQDLQKYSNHIKSGGYICGHDWNWVKGAVTEFAKLNNYNIETGDREFAIKLE